jgi:hypothetical protein
MYNISTISLQYHLYTVFFSLPNLGVFLSLYQNVVTVGTARLFPIRAVVDLRVFSDGPSFGQN